MHDYPKNLDDLKCGKTEFGNAFLMDPDRPIKPEWFNDQKFMKGQEFFKTYVLSVCFAYFVSLFVGFVVEPLAEAVIFTGQSSDPESSRKRYFRTMAHIYSWHTTDIFDPLSLGNRSLRLVRNYHDSARFLLERNQNAGESKILKVTQYDTALVQSGFVGVICLYPSYFGISCSDQDLDDYRYFWRVIGYVLGLEDKYNICAGTLQHTKTICKEIEQFIVAPNLENLSDYYVKLSDDFVKGMSVILPFMDKKVLQAFIYPLSGLKAPKLGFFQWAQLVCLRINFWLLRNITPYRKYMNYFISADLDRLVNFTFDRVDF